MDWYPKELNVNPNTKRRMLYRLNSFYPKNAMFQYAELGVYEGTTARAVLRTFKHAVLHLFDYEERLTPLRHEFERYQDRVHFYGNSKCLLDSYNWPLLQLWRDAEHSPIFDYVFFDGAHTIAIDGLAFFLCERLLKPGGYVDFDDYNWTLRGSSLDPLRIPQITTLYTEEQIEAPQIKLLIDHLVRSDPRFDEIIPNRVFRKSPEPWEQNIQGAHSS